jgi:Rrf2 family protein
MVHTHLLIDQSMSTSTRFVVGVHTLAILAVNRGTPMRSADIAGSANTNPTVIRSLLARMSEAGLTTSQLGTGGGALLAKPAAAIRLLDVYQAVEEGEIFALHRSQPNSDCPVGGNIQAVLRPVLARASAALERELASVTIAEIARELAQRGKFVLPAGACA